MGRLERAAWSVLALGLWSCGGGSGTTASSPISPTSSVPSTPTPTPTPVPTPIPTPTPAPAIVCGVAVGSSAFEPERINCAVGETTQTVRLVFDVRATGTADIDINKVSNFGTECRITRGGTCTWPDGPMSYSPSRVARGQSSQIVATQRFTCSNGGGNTSFELVFKSLFVNTSCGSFEATLTNRLVVGF